MSSDHDSRSSSEDPTIPPKEHSADAPTLPPSDDGSSQEGGTVSPTEADTSFSDAEKSVLLGTKVRYFGDYELLDEIARGGMGVVYKARQVSLNRIVALKMILAGQLASESDVQRFHTEAEAAAKLDHPGIVPIHEVGEHEGQHYFSMGYVDGQSLSQKLNDGPLPPKEAAGLTEKLAEAIAYAHQQGVIHRDLKPANVLMDESGQPRITDFGVAKKLEGDSHLTGTGQILGTPSYMPPEQAAGKTHGIGPAADVYALGAVLYTTLTGRPPFQAASPMDTLLQVLEKEAVAPRQLDAGISRDLETICLKCLEKEPQRRYASAGELAEGLGRFLRDEPVRARPIGALEKVSRWYRRDVVQVTNVLAATSLFPVVVAILAIAVCCRLAWSMSSPELAQYCLTSVTVFVIPFGFLVWLLRDIQCGWHRLPHLPLIVAPAVLCLILPGSSLAGGLQTLPVACVVVLLLYQLKTEQWRSLMKWLSLLLLLFLSIVFVSVFLPRLLVQFSLTSLLPLSRTLIGVLRAEPLWYDMDVCAAHFVGMMVLLVVPPRMLWRAARARQDEGTSSTAHGPFDLPRPR